MHKRVYPPNPILIRQIIIEKYFIRIAVIELFPRDAPDILVRDRLVQPKLHINQAILQNGNFLLELRLAFPQLTEERRRELTKQVKKYGEDAKVAVRNIRRDAMDYVKALKKKSEITEDDQKKAEKDLQDLTDKYIKKVDEACAVKEKELMEL